MSHSFIDRSSNYFAQNYDNEETQKKIDPIAQLKELNNTTVREWGPFNNPPAQMFAKEEDLSAEVKAKKGVEAIQGKGLPVNNNPLFEKEASEIGAKAAQGKAVQVKNNTGGIQLQEDSSLTDEHNKIINEENNWNNPNPESVEWTTEDIIKWKLSGNNDYLFKKKAAFISYYRNVIKKAATMYDIPVFLLAGVTFAEYGGDPMWIDDIADDVRSFDWSGPEWVDQNLTITKHPDLTSFGNVSMQVRRAAETLNYDPANLTNEQREQIINSLKSPIQNLFIAAKHLSDLRDIDYSGMSAEDLGEEEIKVIATRYNRGPDLSLEKIMENLSYGNSLFAHKDEILESLNPQSE